MSAAPSVDECMMTSPVAPSEKRSMPKNLHWILIGFVIVALGVVVFSSAIDAEQEQDKARQEQKKVERQSATSIKTPTDVQSIIEIQSEQEKKVAAQTELIAKLPPVPQTAEEPAPRQLTPEEIKANNDRIEREIRRKESIAASRLIVLQGKGGRSIEALGQAVESPVESRVASAQADRNSALAKLGQQREEYLRQRSNVSSGNVGAGFGGGFAPAANSNGGAMNPFSNASGGNQNSKWLSAQSGTNAAGVIGIDAPASQSVLIQGAIVPAVLVTALNSDMPGQIIGMVTSDVYDSISGRNLIIPRGSKLYGSYNAEVRIGQERAMAAFQRLIRPDGSSVNLAGMPAGDNIGQSGLAGDVNNHFLKMFGYSFMTAGLAHLFQKKDDTTVVVNGTSSNGGIGSAAGQIMVDLAKQVNSRNSNIPPTITVPAGERFNVTVTKDIDIPAYQGARPGQ